MINKLTINLKEVLKQEFNVKKLEIFSYSQNIQALFGRADC